MSWAKKTEKDNIRLENLIKLKDESESWTHLKNLKEFHLIELTKYTKVRGIADEPAFIWWVPYTLRERDVILSSVKKRISRSTHKYGTEIPANISHASRIDSKNENNFWRDSINFEMHINGAAFEILEEAKQAPPGWNNVTCHLVFDMKMDFTCKARWVLYDHTTPDSVRSTYVGVVLSLCRRLWGEIFFKGRYTTFTEHNNKRIHMQSRLERRKLPWIHNKLEL